MTGLRVPQFSSTAALANFVQFGHDPNMARSKSRPVGRPPFFRPTRRGLRRTLWLVPLLLMAGALLDPALVAPVGPLAAQPERIETQFSVCGPGRGPACVIDGDTIKFGQRKVRITGIDAPELANPRCPEEAALARKSAARLRDLLNQGSFEMVGHRLHGQDGYGRDLRVLRRGDVSIGGQLIDEGLAHRYIGSKRSWC
ncbi:thermonuclease family protein [Sphingomonas xanthus]|uniref:thermonuclease family protein n=1 Tax=Sphingomonas xanthus TaxID=2594473 RepID=UPI00164DEF88|nr:thermonuclease family protein [Sphingomonas xanthus]